MHFVGLDNNPRDCQDPKEKEALRAKMKDLKEQSLTQGDGLAFDEAAV